MTRLYSVSLWIQKKVIKNILTKRKRKTASVSSSKLGTTAQAIAN